jgi:hypothetical protein
MSSSTSKTSAVSHPTPARTAAHEAIKATPTPHAPAPAVAPSPAAFPAPAAPHARTPHAEPAKPKEAPLPPGSPNPHRSEDNLPQPGPAVVSPGESQARIYDPEHPETKREEALKRDAATVQTDDKARTMEADQH